MHTTNAGHLIASGKRYRVGGALKRMLDVAASLALIVLLAPLMAGTALLVRMFIGSPVLLRQRRVGRDGAGFTYFKFRTQPLGAENARRTMDAGTCNVSRLLQESGLDELPQLFNVLRGDMSMVGPRPIAEPDIAQYGGHFAECFAARPGVSGMWRINGKTVTPVDDQRVELDLYYVRHWSLGLDARIVAKTIRAASSARPSSQA